MAYIEQYKSTEFAASSLDVTSLRHRAAEYLELYKLRRRAAGARGLLGDGLLEGEVLRPFKGASDGTEDDEVLISQVHYDQSRTVEYLSMLHKELIALETSLNKRRRSIFMGSVLFGIVGTALTSKLLHVSPDGHTKPLRWMPGLLRDLLSVAPLSFGLLFDWVYGHRISTIQAADARLGTLISHVNATQAISDNDMIWMQQPYWRGIG